MKELKKNLKFAWKYTKNQKKELIKYLICNVLQIGISIVIPILTAKIIINLTSNQLYQLLMMAIVIFVIETVRNLVYYFANKCSQIIYRESFIKIQTELGKHILKLQNETLDKNGSGVFIQRLTNDTAKLADIFNVLNNNISNIIIDIGIFSAIFIINKLAFLYILATVIILYIIEKVRVKKYILKDKKYRKENEQVTGFVGEIVRGARDIKMLNAEHNFTNELHNKVTGLNNTKYKMLNTNRKYVFLRGFLGDLTDALLIFLLVYLIKYKSLNIAAALIIHNYAQKIPNIIYCVGMLLEKIKDFNLSSSRIFAIIDSEEFKKEQFGNKHIDKIEGNFKFEDVSFSYDKVKVLNGINFKIKANETVAFVGKSGAGKTTIFNLLCKMYNPDKGVITIDDIDIKELDKDSIRGNITIINQDPYIFNLSIKDNLRLVKENLTEKEMKEACKIACLDEFIESLPDKYGTIVGEGGVNLSGGQKQRLAIARALVQKTEIILFDEATSALDNETQNSIQEAINNMKNQYTILIIAHRLSTIINSDRILFLNEGKIQTEGTHEELLKKSKEYKHLYESEIAKNK